MSTKTQKLTNSRESPVLVQRGPAGYTRYVQHRSRHANETFYQRLGHFYPMIVTLVVCSVLYGIYSHTFQPQPIESIHVSNPIGYELWLKFKDTASHYFELWKQTFTKLKEVGPTIPDTGVSEGPPEYQIPDIIPSTPPRDGLRNPNFHHPHPVDNSIQREIDRITREMDQHIEEARRRGQNVIEMLEEKRNQVLGNIANVKENGQKILEEKGGQIRDSFGNIIDQWDTNIFQDKQYLQDQFEYAKERGQEFLDKIQNNVHQHDINGKLENVKERGQEFLGRVKDNIPSEKEFKENVEYAKDKIQDNFDFAKERSQDILGHLPQDLKDKFHQQSNVMEHAKDNIEHIVQRGEDIIGHIPQDLKDRFQSNFEQGKENIEYLKERGQDILGHIPKDFKEKAQENLDYAKDKVQDNLEYAKDKAQENIDYAKDKVQDNLEYAKDKVQENLEYAKDKVEQKIPSREDLYTEYKNLKQNGQTYYGQVKDNLKENLNYVKDTVEDGVKKKDYDWTTLKGIGRDMHREIPIANNKPQQSPNVKDQDDQVDILENIKEKIPNRDVVLENLDNVIKDFKHKGQEFIQRVEDRREELRKIRDTNLIKQEIDKVTREIENTRDPYLIDYLRSRTFDSLQDLQELQYKLRNGYRDSSEYIYRKKKNN